MNLSQKNKRRINWKLIGRITDGYKRYLVGAIIAVVITILLSYAIPMVTSFTIDFVIAGEDVALSPLLEKTVAAWGGRNFLSSHKLLQYLLLPKRSKQPVHK